MPRICEKRCARCHSYRSISSFLGPYGIAESDYCSHCRDNNPNEVPRLGVWGQIPIQKPSPPTYYSVTVTEVRYDDELNALLIGEDYITHSVLSESLPTHRERLARERKNMDAPWGYDGWAKSHYERMRRRFFENIWRNGYDEYVPTVLLSKRSWSVFWERFRTTETAKQHLQAEGGEGTPWEKGSIGA